MNDHRNLGRRYDKRLRTWRARYSLISRCRGMGWDIFVRGFWYQSCLPPCRISTHPIDSILAIKSRRFTPPLTRRPAVPPGCAHWSTPDTDRAGVPGDRRAIPLGSCSLGIPPSTQARTCRPANRRTGESVFRPSPGATARCEADPYSRHRPAHAARVLCSRDRTCLWPSWPHHTDGGREGQRTAWSLPAGGTGRRARITTTNHDHEPRPRSKVAIRILTEW